MQTSYSQFHPCAKLCARPRALKVHDRSFFVACTGCIGTGPWGSWDADATRKGPARPSSATEHSLVFLTSLHKSGWTRYKQSLLLPVKESLRIVRLEGILRTFCHGDGQGEARCQMLKAGVKPGLGPGTGDKCQSRRMLCKELAGVASGGSCVRR